MKTLFVLIVAVCCLKMAMGETTVVVKYEGQLVLQNSFGLAAANLKSALELVKSELNAKIQLLNAAVLAVQHLVVSVVGSAAVLGQQALVDVLSTIGTVVTGITTNLLGNVTTLVLHVGEEVELFVPRILSDLSGVLGSFENVVATALDGAIVTVVECVTDFQLAVQAEVTGIAMIFYGCLVNPMCKLGEALLSFRTTFDKVLSLLNPLKAALLKCRGGLLPVPCLLPSLVTAVTAGALTLPNLVLSAAADLTKALNLVVGAGVLEECATSIVVGKLTGLKAIVEGATRCAATGAGAVVTTGGSLLGAFGL